MTLNDYLQIVRKRMTHKYAHDPRGRAQDESWGAQRVRWYKISPKRQKRA